MSIRVVVVDDHPVFRDGLGALLGSLPDMEVVAVAADGPEAVAVVQDLDVDVVIMDLNLPTISGVADDVRDRLGHDPVRGDLHRRRQPRQVGDVKLEVDIGAGDQPLGGLRQRSRQPEFVQRGRPQPFDHPPHLEHRPAQLVAQGFDVGCGRAVGAELGGDDIQAQQMPGEGWPEPVVQVAPEAPALLLTGNDEPFQRLLQVPGQPSGVQDAPEMSGEVIE